MIARLQWWFRAWTVAVPATVSDADLERLIGYYGRDLRRALVEVRAWREWARGR